MRLSKLVFPILLVAVRAVGAEFPADAFPVANDREQEFRQARARETQAPQAAEEAYRRLLKDRSFPVPDALQWALARILPAPDAEEYWKAILRARPDSPFAAEAREALTGLCLRQGRLSEAEDRLRDLAMQPNGELSRARSLGRLLPVLDLEGHGSALAEVARTLWVEHPHLPEGRSAAAYLALTGDPFDQVAADRILERGRRLFERGSREEAVGTLTELRRRLSAEDPLRPEATLLLGKSLFHLRRFEGALQVLDELRTDPDLSEEARYYLARCLFGLNRGDEGARELLALARAAPRAPKAREYLGQASRVLDGRGERVKARRAQALLLRRYPRTAEAREVRWYQGWQAYREGRFEEAAERLWTARQSAGRDYGLAQYLYWEGRALAAIGDAQGSGRVHDRLLAEFPLGYYAQLARTFRDTGRGDLRVADPRAGAGEELPFPAPRDEDLVAKGNGAGARAAAYLRLGLPDAARRVLRSASTGEATGRLLYWSEDFQGALAASGRTWLDWPKGGDPDPLDPFGLSYPIAYPKSASAAAREAGIHPHLLLAIAHTESHFDPRSHSVAEARGLLQFIPSTGAATAKALGVKDFAVDDLYVPGTALRLGARHLRELLDRYAGDVALAAAAYNAGEAAVNRWKAQAAGLPGADFVETIPYKETRRYVKKVLTALDAYGRLDPPGLWAPTVSPVSRPAAPPPP